MFTLLNSLITYTLFCGRETKVIPLVTPLGKHLRQQTSVTAAPIGSPD